MQFGLPNDWAHFENDDFRRVRYTHDASGDDDDDSDDEPIRICDVIGSDWVPIYGLLGMPPFTTKQAPYSYMARMAEYEYSSILTAID